MNARALLLTSALASSIASLAGCGSDAAEAPPVTPASCVDLDAVVGADLALAAKAPCGTSVVLDLRVATSAALGGAPSWASVADAPIVVEGGWTLASGVARRSVRVVNHRSESIVLRALEWSTRAPLAADRFLHDGYQSWSFSGFEAIPATIVEEDGTVKPGGADESILGERSGTSWWWTAVADASGRGFAIGAETARVLKSFAGVDHAPTPRLRFVEGLAGDAISLAPGEARELDGVVVAFAPGGASGREDAESSLRAYAGAVAAAARPSGARVPALGGWGSWNLYYADVDASSLADEAEWAAATLSPLGLRDFLLDDGYEPNWGAWRSSTRFGAELADVAAAEEARGLVPAIWLAPVYVDDVDPIVAEHDDWFVHDDAGRLRAYAPPGKRYVALDVTHDDARAHLVDQLVALRARGFRTFKIDFLFGAAIPGRRRVPMTGLESYALWMKAIREAVPDAHLVGCGAPLLPSIGWVDSMRTGPDVAVSLQAGSHPASSWVYVSAEARQTAARAHTDAFWAIDPDVVLLRDGIDDDEAWTFVVSSALAGGNYLSGDGRQASAKRLAMLTAPDVLALARTGRGPLLDDFAAEAASHAIVAAGLGGAEPIALAHVWRTTRDADAASGAVAVFGWDSESYAAEIALPAAGAREIAPGADGVTSTPVRGAGAAATLHVEVPKHATRLFVWP